MTYSSYIINVPEYSMNTLDIPILSIILAVIMAIIGFIISFKLGGEE